MASVGRLRTDRWAGYGVAWSPFYPERLALASSANFGLVGNGRLHFLNVPALHIDKYFDTQDGLYDVAWSEIHENQIVSASGDGSIKLWDVTLQDFPIRNWQEHQREVFSVDWSNIRKDTFASASWDHTVKIWQPERAASILTIPAHAGCVYQASFAPHQPNTVSTCSADGLLKVWDINAPPQKSPPLTIPAHPTEVLSLAWNYYVPHLIATASVDRTIKIHDIRMASSALQQSAPMPAASPATVTTLLGHEYAVRKVAFSPYSANLLASASYDMTARIWDFDAQGHANQPKPLGSEAIKWSSAGAGSGRLLRIHDLHTEFVVGLAWSLFQQNTLATTSWDSETHIFQV